MTLPARAGNAALLGTLSRSAHLAHSLRAGLSLFVLSALTSCGSSTVFQCSTSGQCLTNNQLGDCRVSPLGGASYCTFPDALCASHERWDNSAGEGLAGSCVVMDDAGVIDSTMTVMDMVANEVELASMGCTKDTDCKGDRLCIGGMCISPMTAEMTPHADGALPDYAIAATTPDAGVDASIPDLWTPDANAPRDFALPLIDIGPPEDPLIPDQAQPDFSTVDLVTPADFSTPPDLVIPPDLVPIATCTDGIKNGAETDVDCGGGTCPACGLGKICGKASDCKVGTCAGGVCTALTMTFAQPQTYSIPNVPAFVGIGDINSDSKNDIVTINANIGTGTQDVSILLGAGTTFAASSSIDRFGGSGVTGALFDLDGDNHPDLTEAVWGSYGGGFQTAFGDGAGSFKQVTTSQPTYMHVGGSDLLAGDLDNDARLDLVVVSGAAEPYLVGSGGVLNAATVVPCNSSSSSCRGVLGDFDGDGKLDLVIRDGTGGGVALHVRRGNGDGTFKTPSGLTVPHTAGVNANMVVGDFNNDGKLDLISETDASGLDLFVGDGKGSLSFSATVGTFQRTFEPIAVADFDQDGNQDIVVGEYDSNTVSVLRGKGDGSFPSHLDISAGGYPRALTVGDLDADGRVDIVVGSVVNGGPASVVQVILNRSN